MMVKDKKRIERYEIGGNVFEKHYAFDGEGVRFLKNGNELSLVKWNRELNIIQPMELKERHPNPLIRLKEAHRRKGFLKLINPTPESVVADVGCESGYLAEQFVGKCRQLFCIDIDDRLLSLARRRIGDGNALFLQSNIESLPLADNTVDIAIGSEILEHLPDPGVGLKELVRITKQGGQIVISVPNEPLILALKGMLRTMGLKWALGRLNDRLAIGHVNIFTKKKVQQVCQGEVTISRLFYHLPFCLNLFAVLKK
ncbi:MAG: class I SAM-dependent methyltransferase [Candidatus Tectomicrobia bacterium]|nr:class I SAM-dependent methyltransferase [Candidatus Tectomicrobia bacterium]